MSFMLTRLFTYFTLFSYLVVGSVAVRFLMPEMTSVEVTSEYLQLFTKYEIKTSELELNELPKVEFAALDIPVEKKIEAPKVVKAVAVVKKPVVTLEVRKVEQNELNFNEPVKLTAIEMINELPENMVALYTEFKFESMVASAPEVQDEVSTTLAANVDVNAEPEFFEYPVGPAETPAESYPEVANNVDEVKAEEIAVNDLLNFDYSDSSNAIDEVKSVPVQVAAPSMTTQKVAQTAPSTMKWEMEKKRSKNRKSNKQAPKVTGLSAVRAQENSGMDSQAGFMSLVNEEEVSAPTTYQNRMTIQVTGTDLKENIPELGFEIRFQDDVNETVQDYNSGSITIDHVLSKERMTRSMVVLKRGYAPTNTDLILEAGVHEHTLPLIEQQKFNALMAPFGQRGALGMLLVEVGSMSDTVVIDAPYSQLLFLDENMNETEKGNEAYHLFVGVQAGNTLLSVRGANNDSVNKIVHIHEHELTYETLFFEDVDSEKVKLFEEDLLSSEKRPLVVSTEVVRQFATDKTTKKINNNTHKTDFKKTLLGGRKYLELDHQEEPVFIGYKNESNLDIPSEHFMRFILSKVEGQNLGSRCLVQVNLPKKALNVVVGSESLDHSLVTYTQVLDSDGKFYDSVSEKSKKIIIVGENQGSGNVNSDSKINVRVDYVDGSSDFIGTYCSQNTYLVEQL